MTAPSQLDRTHHFILETFVERGYAPHYVEIANHFGVAPEEGKKLLHDLTSMGLPIWLYPGTDLIASCAPFNNLPTQYRVSVDGRPGWFGQCGFESLALCWVFPGKSVRIESPCLDCGEPINVRMQNGNVLLVTPTTVVAHVSLPAWRWRENWAHT